MRLRVAPVRVRVRQPGHGPGCSAGRPSRTHLLLSSIYSPNAATAAAASVVRCRISACVHKRHSEKSRAGVTDECFAVAAVGFQHFERTMPGDIRDLDQVGAALHGASHEAGAEAVPTKCRRIEAELRLAT